MEYLVIFLKRNCLLNIYKKAFYKKYIQKNGTLPLTYGIKRDNKRCETNKRLMLLLIEIKCF